MINSVVDEILSFYRKINKVRNKLILFLSLNCGNFTD